jgi:hypothetical protein
VAARASMSLWRAKAAKVGKGAAQHLRRNRWLGCVGLGRVRRRGSGIRVRDRVSRVKAEGLNGSMPGMVAALGHDKPGHWAAHEQAGVGCLVGWRQKWERPGKKTKKMKEKKGKEVGQQEALGPNRLGSFSIFKTFYKL